MLKRIFPKTLNNDYNGSIIGLIIFTLITIVKFLMGLNISGLNPFISPEHILQSVDNIPLDTMPLIAKSAIVGSSRAWAILLLSSSIMGFLALIRYRAMVPLLFCFYLFDHILRKAFEISKHGFDFSKQLEMADIINFSLIGLIIIGLIFSSIGKPKIK